MCDESKNEVGEEKVREVFLDDLPRKEGVGVLKGEQVIDWKKSINRKVVFCYDNTEGEIEIVNYDGKYLSIKYLDKEPYKITTGSFQNCQLGKLLSKITSDFKIEVGDIFQDDKRDLIIIDRKIIKDKRGQNWKYYKYRCNKCGFECGEHYKNGEYHKDFWIAENNLLLNGIGCGCCCNTHRVVVQGINDIPTTNPELIRFFPNGYEEAKKYTAQSNRKIYAICPNCNRIKEKTIKICEIYRNHSIGCSCGDGQSYPFKLMFSILEQLNVKFETEFFPDWCKYIMDNKNKKGRYDFYFEINNNKYIVETDGNLGHGNTNNLMNGQTKEESQEIDNEKDKLAYKHGIEVIRIDCKISELDYIKNNILKSKLSSLFNLNNIDWNIAEEFALSNLVKKACELKRNNPDMVTTKIGKIMKLSYTTIREYLKKGSKLGWCDYDSKKEHEKTLLKGGNNKKLVEVFNKNGMSLGIFESCVELSKEFEEKFEIKLFGSLISKVCKGERNHHGGFTFTYVD